MSIWTLWTSKVGTGDSGKIKSVYEPDDVIDEVSNEASRGPDMFYKDEKDSSGGKEKAKVKGKDKEKDKSKVKGRDKTEEKEKDKRSESESASKEKTVKKKGEKKTSKK